MKIAVEEDGDDTVRKALIEEMIAFNREATGLERGKPIVVTVRDGNGMLKGGVLGRAGGDWAYFDIVVLSADMRRGGAGRALMRAAEDEARRLGARDAWLYTMSWQARPFYEKLGYRCFAEQPCLGGKHQRIFMAKTL